VGAAGGATGGPPVRPGVAAALAPRDPGAPAFATSDFPGVEAPDAGGGLVRPDVEFAGPLARASVGDGAGDVLAGAAADESGGATGGWSPAVAGGGTAPASAEGGAAPASGGGLAGAGTELTSGTGEDGTGVAWRRDHSTAATAPISTTAVAPASTAIMDEFLVFFF